MGGGRRYFLPESARDPESPKQHGYRKDGRDLTAEWLEAQDCVVIVTNHSDYDVDFLMEHASLIVDTRNKIKAGTAGKARVVRL